MSLILVIIVIFIILAVAKGEWLRKMSFLIGNRSWLLVGYAVVLIASFMMYLFIPQASEQVESTITQVQLDQYYNDFYEASLNGTLDEMDASILIEKWTAHYDQPTIELKTRYNSHVGVRVVIERKSTNDNTIEAYYYAGKSTAGNIDITEDISKLDVEIEGSTMTLARPAFVELHYARITPEFTISQFKNEREQNNNDYYSHFGPEVLYLKIPANVQVSDSIGAEWMTL